MGSGDLWRKTLNRIPTVFGRLVYIAALQDANTGRYCEPALAQMIGADEADRVLSNAHHQIFSQWLSFSLEEQKNDLEAYAGDTGESPYDHYARLTPRTAREVERRLYFTDLETLMDLARYEPGGASSRSSE
jgi:hypothetical protein